jgi:hypothetical protein
MLALVAESAALVGERGWPQAQCVARIAADSRPTHGRLCTDL